MINTSDRILKICFVLSFLFSLIIARLIDLQVIRSAELSKLAIETRSMKLAGNDALRGVITDRKYRDLSDGGWKQVTISSGAKKYIYQRYGNDARAVHLIGHLDAEGNHGVTGIEAWYDEFLKTPSISSIFAEKDLKGRIIPGRGVFAYPPINYSRMNVVLTIDKDIQKIAEEVSDGKVDARIKLENGAIAIIDIPTGDILALVSRPSFDPLRPLPGKNHNLLNKALEFYYPGSVFKIIVATAAYDKGLINKDDIFYCDGKYSVNSKVYISCWKSEGHGKQTFTEAFANSCNTAFITIGQRVYKSGLEEYIKKFGLDKQYIVGYPYIQKGNIKIGVGKAAIANASIGQEGIKLSPVQIAALIADIARGGEKISPRLVKEIRFLNGPIVKQFPPSKPEKIISSETAKKIKNIMMAVTIDGTGTNAWVPHFGSAGKTGSAQTGMKDYDGTEIVHAWFAGFTPLENPQYAIVVFSEEGKYGGKAAAPVFKLIAEKLLQKDSMHER